jgi:hypothetical protein
MDEPTYICTDCSSEVYDALGIVRKRCLTCQWIADQDDPNDKEELRDWLRRTGAEDE